MSKSVLEGLKPESLWNYFYEISQIPRPSKAEEKIRKHVKDFARKHNFEFNEDSAGNVVIKIPAKKGFEKSPVVVLQGHLDMVCEKNKGTNHDFDNDPIKLLKDVDWLQADGTTLGADNGIGVAAAMSIATDSKVMHGPLEILCTIDEETGMTGVNALQKGFISGKYLLNLDSEEDGAFYVGCSGGVDTVGIYDIKWTNNKKELKPYSLMVTGLKGGHSGMEIQTGRANAIKLLGFLLYKLSEVKFRLASISGGSKRNAIPREAEVTFLIDPTDEEIVKEIINEFVSDAVEEYKKNDPGLKIIFQSLDEEVNDVFTKKFTRKLIATLVAIPHGVIAMSPDIEGLVETSTNLATIFMDSTKIKIGTSQRSSVESAKVKISNSIRAVFELSGASEIEVGDGYPGWKPNMESELLQISKTSFNQLFKKDPQVKAIHAGLECGILGNKYPGLDMISFGPTITGAHSPTERVSIPDVEKFYFLLKAIVEHIAKQK